MIKVIKRTGAEVAFDANKISSAIEKAMLKGSGIYKPEVAQKVAATIEKQVSAIHLNSISIAQIEQMVFDLLVDCGERETARAYEGYKCVRAAQREQSTIDDSVLELVRGTNEEVMNENSNKDAQTISTQRDLIAGEVSKDLALRKMLPPHLAQAHKDKAIHIHK